MRTAVSLRVGFWSLFCVVFAFACEQGVEQSEEEVGEAQLALTCRTVELEASKSYSPASYVNDVEQLSPGMRFKIPAEIPVVSGNAGNGWVRFKYRRNGTTHLCRYKGNRVGGVGGDKYLFHDCSSGATPGTIVKARRVKLHVADGRAAAGTTAVHLTLNEEIPCKGGGPGDGGGDEGGMGGEGEGGGDGGAGGATVSSSASGSSSSTGFDCSGVIIDDGNACTLDACDPSNGVTHTPQVGLSCSDGEPCNGAETCDASGACVDGTPPDPDDGIECTIDTCEPGVGVVHRACTPHDPAVPTTLIESLGFLIDGSDPVQVGVAPGTIEVERAGAIEGHVFLEDGSPAMGAGVRVVNHDEYGTTTTDAAGHFIMLINAEKTLTVAVEADGYLPVQRNIETNPQTYRAAFDVTLLPPDPVVTQIDLETQVDVEFAQGTVATDADGDRQGTVMIEPGTEAVLVMPNGDEIPTTTVSVRVTEYTVGEDGPARMPADLPITSHFTYAMEVSADEAIAAGATEVRFNQPVNYFVENFLGVAVGTFIPLGSYDRVRAVWVPEPDTRVIAIVGLALGAAEIDLDGDYVAESDVELDAVGLSVDARIELASLYPVGQELWFSRLAHFSPWDANMNAWTVPGGGCEPPCGGEDPGPEPPRGCPDESGGSIIECQNQTLRESIPLAGTPYSLTYASDRAPGRTSLRQVTLPLAGSTLPATLARIEATFSIAGKAYTHTEACPCEDSEWFVEWDGRDQFGRELNGAQPAVYKLNYVYVPALFSSLPEFGAQFARWGSQAVVSSTGGGGGGIGLAPNEPSRREVSLSREWPMFLGGWDARAQHLGGLTIDAVHAIDFEGTVYRGDGSRERGEPALAAASTYYKSPVATGQSYVRVLASRDGSVVWVRGTRIFRRSAQGVVTQVAGPLEPGASCVDALDRPALGACFNTGIGDLEEGIDGSLYLIGGNFQVLRIRPDGQLVLFAGNGTLGYSGDGGPAVDAAMRPASIAPAPDGSIYVGEGTVIRRVSLDGTIDTVLGNGTANTTGEDGPAANATCRFTQDLKFGPDGSLYWIDIPPPFTLTHVVRKVDPGGIVSRPVPSAGGFVLASIAFDPTGNLVLVKSSDTKSVVERYPSGGDPYVVAGTPLADPPVAFVEGRPATLVTVATDRAAVGQDGTIYFGLGERLVQVRPQGFATGTQDIVVGSQDGREVYVFDERGRHLQTRDAQRGVVLTTMGYDGEGRLASLTDEHGLVTTIQRDGGGVPTGIEGPYGHFTSLLVNGDGWLETVTDPMSFSTDLAWEGTAGLLAGFSTRNGNQSTFEWDAGGRLITHTHAGGGEKTLTRTETPGGHRVTIETPLGRATTYLVEDDIAGNESRTKTFPNGLSSSRLRTISETYTSVSADGTTTTTQKEPDPRFGMRSSFATSTLTRLPSGLTRTMQSSRIATLSSPADPFSITAWTETNTINGRSSTTSYNLGTRVETSTTAAGRVTSSLFDAQGKVLQIDAPDVASVYFQYDADGRLLTTTQGTRVTGRTYGPDGLLATVTSPLFETTAFGRNARGDVLAETRPDLEVTAFGYDGEGHTTSVTPPDKPAHAMVFNAIEALGSYSPPTIPQGATTTSYSYDLDKMIDSMTQPGPRQVDYEYDSAGRLDEILFPTGSVTRGYSPTTGRVVSIGGPSGVSLSMTYDGLLQKSVSFSGAVNGTVAWDHDTDFRVVTETLNGGWDADFTYDPDSLLTAAGDLTITRDPQSGRVTQMTSGVVVETRSYNEFGELSAMATTAGGTPLLSFSYLHDDLGRITQRTETVGGVTAVTDYFYDEVGRLVQVDEGGSTVEVYSYDANSNRLTSTNAAGTFAATYDDQDRIQTSGPFEYNFTLNGELLNKTDTVTGDSTDYTYDALGNLRDVTLPNGDMIEYVVDGQGRRVGKIYNGVLERAWLWRDQLQPVAELDGAGNVVARFVYAEGVNVPELMVTPTATYRLVKDHLGSVRQVVEIATNAVVQQLEYDAWGRVLVDTSPAFQPFGFAGGLYDSDTGLSRFGTRDYDAAVGRWTKRDALLHEQPDGPNLFGYVRSDPINLLDESGEYAVAGFFVIAWRVYATYRIVKHIPAPPPGFPDPMGPPPEACIDEDFEYCREGTHRKTRAQCCDDVCVTRFPGHSGAPKHFPTPYSECMEACMSYGNG